METLWDFLTFTKGWGYVAAFSLLGAFIPFYLYLTDRERGGHVAGGVNAGRTGAGPQRGRPTPPEGS
jgi:hypothetical protein